MNGIDYLSILKGVDEHRAPVGLPYDTANRMAYLSLELDRLFPERVVHVYDAPQVVKHVHHHHHNTGWGWATSRRVDVYHHHEGEKKKKKEEEWIRKENGLVLFHKHEKRMLFYLQLIDRLILSQK